MSDTIGKRQRRPTDGTSRDDNEPPAKRSRESNGARDDYRKRSPPRHRGERQRERSRSRDRDAASHRDRRRDRDDDERGYRRERSRSRDANRSRRESPRRRPRSRSRSPARPSRRNDHSPRARGLKDSRAPDVKRSPPPDKGKNAMEVDGAPAVKGAKDEGLEPEAALMKRMMGFSGFRSTKNTKVPGNNVGAVRKDKQTKYRQYMNRVGGFNRPLSPSR